MELKSTSTYKMKKSTKMMLSNILDKKKRNEFKRDMIRADLIAAIRPKEDKKKKKSSESDDE